MSTATKPKHIGRNISRIRELRGMKQEALAQAIGSNQQAISGIESSEEIDAKKLEQIAKALGVTVEAIENFSEESVFNFFNNFYDNSASNGQGSSGPIFTFNPLDKVVELYERLIQAEKELVQAEKEKVEYLEKLLKK
ncbi:DNA-binding XRE family transcriptional regulator [Flavobacterium sp. 90]|uniref:helix-turn-helix domain-containing protein n=1 Tax=unclassified Flavobacterium TaxID=196869 RepID=UPI000EB1BB24|nr:MULTISPECIES: helix-turn-helix transcriptional regulator [unclassified Flavobacterium]RKR11508.1 DNA-binding XRE family transcriptional regulator [Flavobacterium sp. 81]TCK55290.1 DNA-binding XRE family transcriptional regulator [Flavobacterium sp. 90]